VIVFDYYADLVGTKDWKYFRGEPIVIDTKIKINKTNTGEKKENSKLPLKLKYLRVMSRYS
jgi:hypothetical protein